MFCKNCGNQMKENTKFCENCGTNIETEPVAPVQTAPAYASAQASPNTNATMPKKKKKGKVILILAIVVVLVLGVAMLLNGEISNVQMATSVDSTTKVPINATNVFSSSDSVINCSMYTNVDAGTEIKAEWYYTTESLLITDYSTKTSMKGQQINFNLSKPTSGWPIGNYEVKIYVNGKYSQSANFEVK